MAIIELRNVSFSYSGTIVIKDLNLAIEDEQIVSIMGPSGCGKSTVLRLFSGLEKPQAGECFFEGNLLKRPSQKLRFSFQDFDAFPWRTVRDNLLLSGASENKQSTVFNVDNLLLRIGLNGHEKKFPAELSAGMRKRLALGRCLAAKPRVIMLDEPFSSLDIDARHEMYSLLQELWEEWRCLFIIVTHDVHEAIILSQQVVVSEPLPFRKKEVVDVPFKYPRDDSIISTEKYLSLVSRLRHLF